MNKFFPKNEFAKNVLTLITGTTTAQTIPIIISPLLTRIYSPEDFGVLGLFLAITSVLGSVANGRYELAIMLPRKEEEVINIFFLGILIASFLTLFLLLIIIFFSKEISNLLGNQDIRIWLYFIPLTVFSIGMFNMLTYLSNRKKQYRNMAKAGIAKSFVKAAIQLVIGLVTLKSTGLILGEIFSHITANICLLKNVVKTKYILKKIDRRKMLSIAKRYKKFPIFSMPSAMLNTASLQVPVVLLGLFFNPGVVGLYSLSHRVISAPMSLIGNSIGQVFFQEASRVKDDRNKIKNLTTTICLKLIKIGFLPFLTLLFFGDYLFLYIFGNKWIIAGEYAQLLSLWIFMVFITSPISTLAIILEKQKEACFFDLSMMLMRIFSIITGACFFNSAYKSVLIYGIVSSILWFIWMIYLLRLASVNIKDLKAISYAVPIIITIYTIKILL